MFKLTEKQEQAHDKIAAMAGKRFNRPMVFRVRGYAGTGKTTLLKVVHESLGDMVAVAPTGKAALRIGEASGVPATTIHRWMYEPRQDPATGVLTLVKKPYETMVVPQSGILVIDEASMIDESVWEDAYDACKVLGMNIVLIGDGFQLPPVELKRGQLFSTMADEFMADDGVDLTEVMRQALDSPIIRASMALRRGDATGCMMDLKHVKRADFKERMVEVYRGGGVTICHSNKGRHKLNSIVRKDILGDGHLTLQAGEPLLVLKNNYDIAPNMFNGEIADFTGWKVAPSTTTKVSNFFKETSCNMRLGIAVVGSGRAEAAVAVEEVFGQPEAEQVGEIAIGATVRKVFGKNMPYLSANFGYTLTAHKSQGSEWNSVLVAMEPTIRLHETMSRRWLYTALTRAKESCHIHILGKEGVNDL